MKKSKLLTFTLISIVISMVSTLGISSATVAKPETATKPENIAKPEAAAKPESIAKPESTPKPDNTVKPSDNSDRSENPIGIIGLVLGVLNLIGLGATSWFGKEAIDKIKDRAKSSEQRIEKLKSQYQPLEHQVKKVDSDYQNYSNKTNKELERLRQSVEEVSRKAASMQQSAAIPQSNYRSERQSSSAERYPAAPVNIQLSPTEYYNNGQNDFQNKYQITAVGREAENLNQSRAAQTDSVVLAGDPQGNYWLFSDNAETYLVPKQNLKITDSRLSTTNDLFECHNYNEYNYHSFVLIKPAVLVSRGSGTWQLKEKGKLQFG